MSEELQGAVAEALRTYGVGLLCEPHRFVGAVSDVADPESREMNVLYRCCEQSWLSPFAEAAAARDAEALSVAACRAELTLADDFAIARDVAHTIAQSIALGACDSLGIAAVAQQATLPPISDPPGTNSHELERRRFRTRMGAGHPDQPQLKAASAWGREHRGLPGAGRPACSPAPASRSKAKGCRNHQLSPIRATQGTGANRLCAWIDGTHWHDCDSGRQLNAQHDRL